MLTAWRAFGLVQVLATGLAVLRKWTKLAALVFMEFFIRVMIGEPMTFPVYGMRVSKVIFPL